MCGAFGGLVSRYGTHRFVSPSFRLSVLSLRHSESSSEALAEAKCAGLALSVSAAPAESVTFPFSSFFERPKKEAKKSLAHDDFATTLISCISHDPSRSGGFVLVLHHHISFCLHQQIKTTSPVLHYFILRLIITIKSCKIRRRDDLKKSFKEIVNIFSIFTIFARL